MTIKQRRKNMWVIACDAKRCRRTVADVQGTGWFEVRLPDWPEGGPNQFVETVHFCSPEHFDKFYRERWENFARIEAEVDAEYAEEKN